MNIPPAGKAWRLHVFVTRFGLLKHLANRFLQVGAVALLALVVGAGSGYAQSKTDGAVFGRILNPTTADLSGATATLTNRATGASRSTTVASGGTFEFPAVAVGNYDVALNLKGRAALKQSAYVGVGSTATARFEIPASDTVQLEEYVVSGANVQPIDVASTVIGLNIRADVVTKLPVPRNITAVALLTPGVSAGDRGFFGNLASFAGASVGENAYYLNGYNITDFRRGLGFSTVPFQFFSDFQVLTSGYSAEYGRSTGGVVNAVSKSGGNEFHASVGLIYEPKQLNENAPDVYGTDGKLAVFNSLGSAEVRTANFEVSGPIWKDHFYFYGLYQMNETKTDFIAPTTSSSRTGTSITQRNFRVNDNPLWAAKIDWLMTPEQKFEYTTFSDRTDQETAQYAYPWTSANGTVTLPAALGALSNQYRAIGGRTNIYRYSGNYLDDRFSLSALYGSGTKNDSITSDVSGQPYIVDNRSSAGRLSGAGSLTEDKDTRTAKRIDGVVRFDAFGSHALKFGYDNENNKAHTLTRTSGDGTAYTYELYTGGTLQNSATPPPGTTQIAQISVFANGGDFRVITEALYVEDNWKLFNDRLNLNLGLRNEMLDNRNGNDKTFIKIKNMRAPRVSAAYDLNGDGLSKVTASWGRYFLQIPANTAARMASGETYYTDYYVLNSLKSDNLPNLGPKVGERTVTGTGIVPGVETLVSTTIQPMYQDEFTLGYERALGKKWRASVKGIQRKLAQTIEDEAVDAALGAYALKKGYTNFEVGGFDYYVLTNPGSAATFYVNMKNDLNSDGVVDISDQSGGIGTKEQVTLDAGALGYPKASRNFYSVILELERPLADKWFANFSYVWSQSYGNYEGSVYSDIGQTDAGITQLFDQPGLVDGSYGPLPNDRRHTFKAFGGYQITKELQIAANYSAQSGRAVNGLGLHPTDAYARVYGGSSYYVNGVLAPRGSFGRTPWVHQIDLALRYRPTWGRDKFTLGADVFNVPNFQTETARFERSVAGTAPLAFFQKARTFQTPRYVRISATYEY